MPTTKQINNNRNTINFSPILGGYYDNTALSNKATYGAWWSTEMSSSASRYYLRYNGSDLSTSGMRRRYGFYVRCVSEEKTVTDLTYLQDMTGEIANNML
ncbi:hypothetical protein IJG27_00570 [Candidatus Saccharibacteria bacterium]|nr:hypothetical protein [Candidatus Saccharibacteria bacterium]MBQ6461163.1 hypothetical protein [Candidatus Saccharibacteria bacterium]